MIPELSVVDCDASLRFYRDVLGATVLYQRPEEGFAYLAMGQAEWMIDQIGLGRDFDSTLLPGDRPFGRGVNLQIRVAAVQPLLEALRVARWPLVLPLEDRWYRRDDIELGNRQFVVADPDGYLLRFHESLGRRPARG